MIAKDLLASLYARRGPIYVEVSNGADIHIVQVIKLDLIHFVDDNFQRDQETGYCLSSDTFGRDYSA